MSRAPQARTACLDLDTFFVSVERLLDPSLEGKQVVVGGRRGSRGVVTSASYEVRPLGVRSGMPIGKAERLAPDAVFLPTRHKTYSPYAEQVKATAERFCPVVQTASIDEFFLDWRGCDRLFTRPGDTDADAAIERVAWELRDTIQAEVGLPASIGIGGTRTVAKVASGRAKPAGVYMVHLGEEFDFFAPLPVRKYPGIGPSAEARLLADEIETLGDLLCLPPGPRRSRHAGLIERLLRDLAGLGAPLGRDRPAFMEHDPAGQTVGSISNERTFHADVGDREQILAQLQGLAERTAWRARKRGLEARTISLKLRYADFQTISRSRTGPPTHGGATVFRVVRELFEEAYVRRLPVRLLGVALSNLEAQAPQLALPFDEGARKPVSRALDAVRESFGYDAIQVGARTVKATAEWHK